MSVLVIAAIYVACALAIILLADHIVARTFRVSRQSERANPAYVATSVDIRESEISPSSTQSMQA